MLQNQRWYNDRNSLLITCIVLFIPSVACICGGSDSSPEATIQAQQATITAQENAILKITIEAQGNSKPEPRNTSQPPRGDDDTSGVVEFETPAVKPTPDNVLYFDDFSNNNNGWSLTAKNNGAVGFVQQHLVLSPNNKKCIITPIPNFNVENDYYIESEIKVSKEYDAKAALGYIIGAEPAQYFKYGLARYDRLSLDSSIDWGIFSFSPNNELYNPSSETSLDGPLWEQDKTFTLGMEFLNGVYTLYLNGENLASNQFTPSGNRIGVFACSTWSQADIHFDNMVIRKSR